MILLFHNLQSLVVQLPLIQILQLMNVNALIKFWKDLAVLSDIVLQKILKMTNYFAMLMLTMAVLIPNNLDVFTICSIHMKPVKTNEHMDFFLFEYYFYFNL